MTTRAPTSTQNDPGSRAWFRRFTVWLVFGALALCALAALLAPPVRARPANAPFRALGASVVISGFRTRGPNGGNDEFIELFNPTEGAINIAGWKISGSNNAGTTGIRYTIPALPAVLLQPGQYYLIVNNTALTGYSGSVSPDATYSTGIADNGGLALLMADNSLVDQVGMSTGSAYKEGNVLAPLTGDLNNSYVRNPNGTEGACYDYNNNATDFVIQSPSAPNNSESAPAVCPAPTPTPEWQHRIFINEVAWGGTQADDTLGQWIELYNPGADLSATDMYLRIPGKGDIPLPGLTLPAGGYYLIERNETDTSAPADLVVAFPILNPAGDSLFLYTSDGNLIDSANANGGPWPAGNRFFSYASMERRSVELDSDSAWLTFWGTPFALDRLNNPINGSPGGPNSVGATSTPTVTPSPTSTATPTPTRTVTPTPGTSMEVIISEVAWMGTIASSSDEWIELYNPGLTSINLAGWRITDADGKALFTFSKCSGAPQALSNCVIGPQDFLILVNKKESIKNAAGEFLQDQEINFTMNNSGGVLRLLNAEGVLVDVVNKKGLPWPAGRATSSNPAEAYCSMERSSLTSDGSLAAAWLTYAEDTSKRLEKDRNDNAICGSPGRRNWSFSVTATPTPRYTPSRTPNPKHSATPTVNRATPEAIVINEFLPHPRSDWNNDGVIDSGDEFIELINLGAVAVTLNNYRLDDQQGDSSPYTISGVTLQPGTRMAFFASETGILLGDGGDSVRLFKPSGQIADAFTYGVIKELDRSWCRYPDGKFTVAGQSNWSFGCQPSPGETNLLASTERVGLEELPLVCRSPKLPLGVYLAECDRIGLWNWNSAQPALPLVPPYLEADGILFIFE